jgi:hypothetical protein
LPQINPANVMGDARKGKRGACKNEKAAQYGRLVLAESSLFGSRFLNRQRHADDALLAGFQDFEFTAVPLKDAAGDKQAQSSPSWFSGKERFARLRLGFRREARTIVFDLNTHHAA